MSIEHVASVLTRYHGKPHHKLTLLVLADYADSGSGQCWPSYEAIAAKVGVTRGTAIRNVSDLIEQGVLERIERGGFRVDPESGRQVYFSNLYRVRKDVIDLMPHWRSLTETGARDARSHGGVGATVYAAPALPCSGGVGATLTTNQEPSGRTVSAVPVENLRDRTRSARLEVRSAIFDSLER